MELKNFTSAIAQIAEEKGIPEKKVIEIIESAIAAAYKKEYGEKGQKISAKLDSKSGKVKFWQIKQVVDEKMLWSEQELEDLKNGKIKEEEKEDKVKFNPERHIMEQDAKKIDPKIKIGEELEILLKTHEDYGRIAAQTAKQVILQRIKETEKEMIFEEYKSKEGEVISGIVQRIEKNSVFLDIGKTLGILSRDEQIPGEFYRPGQRLKVYVIKIEQTLKGPVVFLSRSYPKLLSKLFELEVPEVSAESVKIKSIAREPGSRSKVAVFSEVKEIDPIGAMVGQRGTRVGAVISELGGEKIDIIEWSEEPEQYITNSLSPAKVLEVRILPKNKALVIVPEDQLSLAIGKNGQNVRLAVKLTGWKIDVKSQSQVEEGEKVAKKEEKAAKKEEKAVKKEEKAAKTKKKVKKNN